MKYDLKDILTFITVANLKNFTRAAEKLGVSKSVITTRISDLEKATGINILARTTKEVNLTTDGHNFFNHCQTILRRVEKLNDFIDNCKEITGSLKIVLPPYFSRYHIIPYLGEFLAKYPKLKLDIQLTENPVNIIKEGFDLQVRIQIPEEENLEVSKLITNRKIVCASPEYLKKNGTPKTPKDLLNHNCIIFGENAVWSFKEKSKNQSIDLRDLKGNIICDNGEIIKELVLAGLGITMKSACDIKDEVRQKKLVTILNDYEAINQTSFYIVYPSGRITSPKIKAFVDFFKDKLAKIDI